MKRRKNNLIARFYKRKGLGNLKGGKRKEEIQNGLRGKKEREIVLKVLILFCIRGKKIN